MIGTLIGQLSSDKLVGVHLAVNVFIGAAVSWLLLRMVEDLDPIWAIASMVAASDPHVGTAFATFRARMINAMLGCAVGLLVLAVGSTGVWKLPLAMSISVLLSSYVVRVPVMWRQAPIVAALVMASGLTHQSKIAGIEAGIERVGEVLVGCLIGLIVSWVMARIWPVPAAISRQA